MAMTQEEFEDARAMDHERDLWREAVAQDGFEGDFEDWLEDQADRAERLAEEQVWQSGCGPR